MKNTTFIVSLTISIVFIVIGILFTDQFGALASSFLDFVSVYFGSFYLLANSLFILIALYFAFSKYGKLRLGKKDERPEFSTFTWIAMLYSAALATTLLFWGIGEPVTTYLSPPTGEGRTVEAAETGMLYTFFHFGFNNWAPYSMVGLILAYFMHRKKYLPLFSRSLYPLFGDKVNGPIGVSADVIVIIASVFGISTSLGLSMMQVSAGLSSEWGMGDSTFTHVILLSLLTVIFIASAYTGIHRGIKILSNVNMWIAIAIMLWVMVTGPTIQIFDTFIGTTGDYLQNFASLTLGIDAFRDNSWIGNKTLFYWGQIFTWGSFIGVFIARISKGRTIRDFIIGTILIPTVGTFVWFATMGGSALHFIQNLGITELADTVDQNLPLAIFEFLKFFPMSPVIILLMFVLIFTFIITSADSGSYVLAMLSERSEQPSNKAKITWGLIMFLTTLVLLLSGGLDPLYSASVLGGLPLAIVLILMSVSFIKAIRNEDLDEETKVEPLKKDA
ncbi:BCCT family transporter [Bacillus piscicola]|uniref:BCCT family transporter n=1 Tax=Bacillus piscicola TaxID=1632684 RepID=UPI001F091017|nr:BCCT family transporter [Bacillus piscicola]